MDDKNEKENTKKYNSQGQSAIPKRWFDLDHEWLEENFSTRGPEFYKIIYQMDVKCQEMKTYQFFVVYIGNVKNIKIDFHQNHEMLMLKYSNNNYD